MKTMKGLFALLLIALPLAGQDLDISLLLAPDS